MTEDQKRIAEIEERVKDFEEALPNSMREYINDISYLLGTITELRAEVEQWRNWGIVEVAVRNPQVADYMDHWEGRATKAEAEVERLRATLKGDLNG